MSKSHTKEERFLIHLNKLATEAKNLDEPFEYAEIAKSLGQSEKGVKTTVQILTSTNFIKKLNKSKVFITPHGVKLVEQLEQS
ncbi:MAG: Mn-dependent DtxR family transcriptional regulator [Chlamydiales bacterium]|jgi:Mn-dependent DtxR family transcriptional regulator